MNVPTNNIHQDCQLFIGRHLKVLTDLQKPIALTGISARQYRLNAFKKALEIAYYQGRNDEQKVKR